MGLEYKLVAYIDSFPDKKAFWDIVGKGENQHYLHFQQYFNSDDQHFPQWFLPYERELILRKV